VHVKWEFDAVLRSFSQPPYVGSWSKILAIMYLIICLHRPLHHHRLRDEYCELCQLSLFIDPPFLSFEPNISAPWVSLSNLRSKHSTVPAGFQVTAQERQDWVSLNFAREQGRGPITWRLPCRLRQPNPMGWEIPWWVRFSMGLEQSTALTQFVI
jgi:hypothetical protein